MLEKIKEEINSKTKFYDFNEKIFRNIDTCNHLTEEFISKKELFEILNKYNNRDKDNNQLSSLRKDFSGMVWVRDGNIIASVDNNGLISHIEGIPNVFKTAWEELKNKPYDFSDLKMEMQELEQKYGIGNNTK